MKRQFSLFVLVVLPAFSAVAQETQTYAPLPWTGQQPYANASIQPEPQPLTDDTPKRKISFLELVAEEQEGIAHGARVTSSRRLMHLSGL